MSARWQPPLTPTPGVRGEDAAGRSAQPDVTAALLRAAHTTSRTEAIRHLMDAVSAGLHAPDAMKALAEWDAANPTQQIHSSHVSQDGKPS